MRWKYELASSSTSFENCCGPNPVAGWAAAELAGPNHRNNSSDAYHLHNNAQQLYLRRVITKRMTQININIIVNNKNIIWLTSESDRRNRPSRPFKH